MRLALLCLLAGCSDAAQPAPLASPIVPAPPSRPMAPSPPPIAIARLPDARAGSPIALATRGGATLAYIADADAAAIRVVDLGAQRELATFALPGKPAQLVVLADGRIAASLRDRNQVLVLSGTGLPDAPFAIARRIAVAAEPIGLAVTRDDRTLLVASGWGHALTAIAIGDGAVTATWELAAEPRTVVAADDGAHAYVSHAVGHALEVVDLAGTTVAPIPLAGGDWLSGRHGDPFVLPREPCQGYALAESKQPAGRVFAPQVLAFTGGDTVSTGYGDSTEVAPERFDVAVIDEDRGAPLGDNVVDEGHVERDSPVTSRIAHADFDVAACALPRAAVASGSGALYVTCLGDDRVVELDGAQVSPMTALEREWPVAAGPTGLALDESRGRMVVWSQFAQTATSIDLATGAARALRLGDHVDRGRDLFYATTDKRISADGRACASCHPDGRQDTLVWSSPLGPRQTPMLAGRLVAPFGWSGDAVDLAHHVKRTFENLRGTGLTGPDLDALLAYVAALPVPTAAPPADLDPALVAGGKRLFGELGCAVCHGDDGRTPDGQRHDVRSEAQADLRRSYDTPSLRFVGGTAPYYHDGRYDSLRELLVASAGRMTPRKLAEPELLALQAYLLTL